MKIYSLVAASAIGLFALACAQPADAWTVQHDGPPGIKPDHSHKTAAAAAPRSHANRRPLGESSGKADASAGASASSQGGMGVGSQGQSLTVDNHAGTPASSAIAPALSSSNDTCMGSTSVGAAGVAFGLSFGTSYTDDNCMMLKNARELWNMGFRGAAVARMCMDERNRHALEISGVPCPPADGRARRNSAAPDAVFSKY